MYRRTRHLLDSFWITHLSWTNTDSVLKLVLLEHESNSSRGNEIKGADRSYPYWMFLYCGITFAAGIIAVVPGIFERTQQSMVRRCTACVQANGRAFEQFLWIPLMKLACKLPSCTSSLASEIAVRDHMYYNKIYMFSFSLPAVLIWTNSFEHSVFGLVIRFHTKWIFSRSTRCLILVNATVHSYIFNHFTV